MLCNDITRLIWLWCLEANIHLTVAHLPGSENQEADYQSRQINENTEWKLAENLFSLVTSKLGLSIIDLRLNHQLDRYVSWRPDPFAFAIDAFTLDWN